MTAQRLRQGLDQCSDLFPQEPRHQPLEWPRVERVEQGKRQRERHAILLVPRLETIGQRESLAVEGEIEWIARFEIEGEVRPDQVLPLEVQALGVVALGGLAPRFESLGAHDLGRDARIIEIAARRFIDQDVQAPGAMLEIRRLGHQPAVVDHEWGGAVVVALDQGRSDEQVPRCRGIDGRVVHLAPVGEGQAIERHALVGTGPAGLFLPVRV